MRVAMLADHPGVNSTNDGGVQAVARRLCDAIAAMGDVELHVIRMRKGIQHATTVQGPGYVLHSLPIGRLGTATGFAHDQYHVDSTLDMIRPDLVHSQGAGYYGILAKRTCFPTVVTIHGIVTKEARFQHGPHLKVRTYLQGRMGDHYCVNNASHTILVSPYVAAHYGQRLKGHQYSIPNPVTRRFFDLQRTQNPSGKILFAGRITALKGVLDLVHAFGLLLRRLPELRLGLAGSMSDNRYVEKVRREILRLGLSSKVDFLGLLDEERLSTEMSQCDCLVLPSYQENAPMVVQEAMACGVPVVATNVGGLPYLVDEGSTGFLFAPGNIQRFSEILHILLSDNRLRNTLGDVARQKAIRNYDSSTVAHRTVEVYSKIIS